jgi:hypothetical protein
MFLNRLIRNIFRDKKKNIPSPLIPLPRGERKTGEGKKEVQKPTELERITGIQETLTHRIEKLESDLEKATAGYRQMLISNNPDILPDLINGGSIEALDRSLTTGRELTEKVKKQLEKQTAEKRVPGGAPVRMPPDTENLSSHEKIIYGLEQK